MAGLPGFSGCSGGCGGWRAAWRAVAVEGRRFHDRDRL